jgi:hypothetical protein
MDYEDSLDALATPHGILPSFLGLKYAPNAILPLDCEAFAITLSY